MRAGTHRVDITPSPGVPMDGYIARARGAEGVHDSLFARALVLESGGCRVALVSADLCGIDAALAGDIRRRIEQEVGIPPSHTLLAMSHTHAGPVVAPRRIIQGSDAYRESLQGRLVGAVAAAAGRLVPVAAGAGRVKVYLGINRRERTPDNRTVLGVNPSGYASAYSHVLLVARERGGPLGILFTYGAHPVVLGPENLELSGDYPGCAARVVEENFGDSAVALCALGFAGDVNVSHEKRDFGEVETVGTALGRAVLEELKGVDVASDLELDARSIVVPLPLEPPPPLREAERILYDRRHGLTSLLGRGEEEVEINERRMAVEWAAELVRLAAEGREAYTADLEIQVVRIGSIALVALSAEVFAEYGKLLEELSPFEHTFAVSNANGGIGYLPTAAAFDEGGYEVETAPRYFVGLPFKPEIEGIIRGALQQLLGDMAPAQAPAQEPEGPEAP